MEQLAASARPLRIAIIGAGPAGLYAAEALLKQHSLVLTVDIFNRFPTPFGLVRDGVAPDHQSIKAVIRVFDKVLANPRVRFFGNVTYGVDIHHEELKHFYDQIIYAVGAQADRRMGIPGEEMPNSLPATAFVGWYNGHPDSHSLPVDLSCERAVVVGNGNVAMDVARMLVLSPDVLMKTDIAAHALKKLRESKIREVVILGRRGAAQASFTNPEIKELGRLGAVDVIVDPQDIELDPSSRAIVEKNRTAAVNLEYLHAYAVSTAHSASRRITMRFLASPVEIRSDNGQIMAVKIERNESIVTPNGALIAKGTGKFEHIEAGLVLRSIGYRSVPIEGVPFDHITSTMSNIAGRIVHADTGKTVPGEYVVGWAKRGPTGLIGNNKPDAAATVEAMLTDLPTLQGISDECRDLYQITTFLHERDIDYVTYQDWKQLDQYEVDRGAEQGCPRVKITSTSEMMAIIHQAREGSAGMKPAIASSQEGADAQQITNPHVYTQSPVMIYWEMTRACDLACKHCRAEAILQRNPLELTTQEAKVLLSQLKEFRGHPAPHLVMTGGDPLKRPDLLELITYGISLGLQISLAPSATSLITFSLLEQLKKVGLTSMSLSLDGSTAQIHDTFRQVTGCFDSTLKAIHTAREAGLPLQVNTLVSVSTLVDLPRIYDLLTTLDIMCWSVFFLVRMGRGRTLEEITPTQCDETHEWLYKLSKISPFLIRTTEAPSFRRVTLTMMQQEGIHTKNIVHTPVGRSFGIRDGNGIMFISHIGDVYPSGFLPISAGNIRKDNPVDIYQDSELFVHIRDLSRLKGKCSSCLYRFICGGSRARAWAATRDYMESDPICPYQPNIKI
jgi:ferredoxin--NADP+ reductase